MVYGERLSDRESTVADSQDENPERLSLYGLVDEREWGRAAILRALERLPERLRKEYASKLQLEDQRPGITHELRLLGRLIIRSDSEFQCLPFPTRPPVDAIIRAAGQDAELEITAHCLPQFNVAVRRVADRMSRHLNERHPGLNYHVEFRNPPEGFPIIGTERRLDEDRLEQVLLEEIHRAIRSDGSIDASREAESETYRLLVDVRAASDKTSVRQASFTLPGGTDVDQVRRAVRRKTQRPQWSGGVPGILAVVLEYWPDAGILETLKDNRDGPPVAIAEQAFVEDRILAAIVAIPCNADDACKVIGRSPGGDGLTLPSDALASLEAAFAFTYVDGDEEPRR